MTVPMNNQPSLPEVVQQVEDAIAGRIEFLPANVLRNWLQSNNIEVLGAASYVLLTRKLSEKIKPELTLEEQQAFLLKYWDRCVIENPVDEWSSSRHIALRESEAWFRGLLADKNKNEKLLLQIKSWFASLFLNSNSEVRLSVVHGALEHLFESKAARAFFSDWQNDESLRAGFESASLWGKLQDD